jgi:hypothetical protein
MNQFDFSAGGSAAALAGSEGASGELFALTDEQILEIEPESSAETREDAAEQTQETASGLLNAATSADERGHAQNAAAKSTTPPHTTTTSSANGGSAEPPGWLAELMNDPRSGGEAREFWNGAAQARAEAAAYREVFAAPAEAKVAAERARALNEIDRAYFAGDVAERSKLAATMLREDPAAFRAMVFEGLRALEAAEKNGGGTGAADSRLGKIFGGGAASSSELWISSQAVVATATIGNGETAVAGHHGQTERDARVAAYASFEKSANEDLERSVGVVIERTLAQALPGGARGNDGALKARLVGAIREDVEKALQGDRALGEQVARVLSGQRLDDGVRRQVVRLIGERAEQLVPGVAKKVLGDWTRTTLAAHRVRSGNDATVGGRRDVAAASGVAEGSQNSGASGRGASPATEKVRGRGVDYRKFSDEQILGM